MKVPVSLQKGFWERSPWLSQGSLVLLRPQQPHRRIPGPGSGPERNRNLPASPSQMILAEVNHRDVEELAGRRCITGAAWAGTASHTTRRRRCLLGVTPCTPEDTLKALDAFASFAGLNNCFANKQRNGMRQGEIATFSEFLARNVSNGGAGAGHPPVLYEMLELSPDFSVSKAVLRSLQKVHATEDSAVGARRVAARHAGASVLSASSSSLQPAELFGTADARVLPLAQNLFVSPLVDTRSGGAGSASGRTAGDGVGRSAGTIAPPAWEQQPDAAEWIETQLQRFDEAQTAAFHFALTSKVAMIQGPPGVHPSHACSCIIICMTMWRRSYVGCPGRTSIGGISGQQPYAWRADT